MIQIPKKKWCIKNSIALSVTLTKESFILENMERIGITEEAWTIVEEKARIVALTFEKGSITGVIIKEESTIQFKKVQEEQ